MSSRGGYNVYRVEYEIGIKQIGTQRYHTVIFVETQPDGAGRIHHIAGDVVSGMFYEVKDGTAPEFSNTYHQKILLGWISAENYPTVLNNLLESLPPPEIQSAYNPETMRYEPCRPDGTLRLPYGPPPRIRMSTEWTEEQAIPHMRYHRLLHPGTYTR